MCDELGEWEIEAQLIAITILTIQIHVGGHHVKVFFGGKRIKNWKTSTEENW